MLPAREQNTIRRGRPSSIETMTFFQKLKDAFRRRPLTDGDLAARAEAKVAREQMLQDRLSQSGGQNYRAGGR